MAIPSAVGASEALALNTDAASSVNLATRDGQVAELMRFYTAHNIDKTESQAASIIDSRRKTAPAMNSVQWETMCVALAKKYSGNRPPPFPEADAPQEVLHIFICEQEVKQEGLGSKAQGKEYILYGARVNIRCASGRQVQWWIFRRYSDWLALHAVLLEAIEDQQPAPVSSCPKPPPKRIWNTDPNVVSRRTVELNRWLAEVVSDKNLACSRQLLAWLRMGDLQRGQEISRGSMASAGFDRLANGTRTNDVRGTCMGHSSLSLASINLRITVPIVEFREENGSQATFWFTIQLDSTMVQSWTVSKRYSQFGALRQALTGRLKSVALPPLPAKRFLVTQAKAEARREELELFLNKLLKMPNVAVCDSFLEFLEVPKLLCEAVNGAPASISGTLSAKVEARAGFVSSGLRHFQLRGTGLSWCRQEGNYSDGSIDVTQADIAFARAEDHDVMTCDVAIIIRSELGLMVLSASSNETILQWATAIFEAAGRGGELTAVIVPEDLLMLSPQVDLTSSHSIDSNTASDQATNFDTSTEHSSPGSTFNGSVSEHVESAMAWKYWAPEGGWHGDPQANNGQPVHIDAQTVADLFSNARNVELESQARGSLPSHPVKAGKNKMIRLYELELCKRTGDLSGTALRWSVSRRFRDFVQLRQALLADVNYAAKVATITFPPRTGTMGPLDGNDPAVVASRQQTLLSWLECVLEPRHRSGATASHPQDNCDVLTAGNDLRNFSTATGSSTDKYGSGTENEEELHCSPDLLLFLGMRRAAQLQRERRKAAAKRSAGTVGRMAGRQRSAAVDSTDRLGRSIPELLAAHSGQTATVEIVDEQLAECAAFVAVMPKLIFPVREMTSTMGRAKKRTVWLGQDSLELLRTPDAPLTSSGGSNSIGPGAGSQGPSKGGEIVETKLSYAEIIRVQPISAKELRLLYRTKTTPRNSSVTDQSIVPSTAEGPEFEKQRDSYATTAMKEDAGGYDEIADRQNEQKIRAMIVHGLHGDIDGEMLRLQCDGSAASGLSATQIAAEITDRINLYRHIQKKNMQKQSLAAARTFDVESNAESEPVLEQQERRAKLSRHLKQMTGLSEQERIVTAVIKMLVGEDVSPLVFPFCAELLTCY
eukprot:SAG31_NODE_1433_length_8368_cov_8.437901_1_plen_1112_part_00